MIKTHTKKLSPRLETVLGYVEGRVLADIGTDHAHLPIAAIQRGLVEKAIACDCSPGPLQFAVAHVESYAFTHRIETRLGFGLRTLAVGEADCVVITGMGGMRILEILRDCPDVTASIPRLILGPQHDLLKVCDALPALGFTLADQKFVQEKHKNYHIVLAIHTV